MIEKVYEAMNDWESRRIFIMGAVIFLAGLIAFASGSQTLDSWFGSHKLIGLEWIAIGVWGVYRAVKVYEKKLKERQSA